MKQNPPTALSKTLVQNTSRSQPPPAVGAAGQRGQIPGDLRRQRPVRPTHGHSPHQALLGAAKAPRGRFRQPRKNTALRAEREGASAEVLTPHENFFPNAKGKRGGENSAPRRWVHSERPRRPGCGRQPHPHNPEEATTRPDDATPTRTAPRGAARSSGGGSHVARPAPNKRRDAIAHGNETRGT